MVDPANAAASGVAKVVAAAVSKQFDSRAGIRLGSRDERRRVYARFQASVSEAVSFAQYLRMERKFAAPVLSMRRIRELSFMVHERQSELLQAYMELRLVTNPEPLLAADKALSATAELLDAGGADDAGFDERVAAAAEQQRAFTDVCRDDLWYLPQPWQVWRRAARWWRSRRKGSAHDEGPGR